MQKKVSQKKSRKIEDQNYPEFQSKFYQLETAATIQSENKSIFIHNLQSLVYTKKSREINNFI